MRPDARTVRRICLPSGLLLLALGLALWVLGSSSLPADRDVTTKKTVTGDVTTTTRSERSHAVHGRWERSGELSGVLLVGGALLIFLAAFPERPSEVELPGGLKAKWAAETSDVASRLIERASPDLLDDPQLLAAKTRQAINRLFSLTPEQVAPEPSETDLDRIVADVLGSEIRSET